MAKTVCRHAVKANDPLAGRELENLVEDLRRCAMPYTCPHGRPTIIEIKRHKLKLVVGIMNDGGYGAEIHKFRADGIDPAEVIFGRPDFAAIARGFGLRGTNITSLDQFGSLLRDYEASGEAEVWNIPISDRVPSLYTLRAAQAKH